MVDVWTRWALLLTPTLVHVNVPEKSTLLKRQVHILIYDNYGSKLYERVQAAQNWSDKVQYGPRWSKIVIWICVPEISERYFFWDILITINPLLRWW